MRGRFFTSRLPSPKNKMVEGWAGTYNLLSFFPLKGDSMYEKNRLQTVYPILKHYAIEPHFVEELGRVKKIYSNKGVFALKK